MGFYSMPRYFQAMPQVGKPLRAQKEENIRKIPRDLPVFIVSGAEDQVMQILKKYY